jgi:16S rRNA (guanine1207-N2)-methyltransferase
VNLRALHLAQMSADKNKLNVNIYESDAYANVKGKYDYIITNPPIRAGKKKVYEILINARDFLKDDGALWFVMRKDQGVNSTLKDIEKYYKLSIKSKKKGFFVVCATKGSKNVDNV